MTCLQVTFTRNALAGHNKLRLESMLVWGDVINFTTAVNNYITSVFSAW